MLEPLAAELGARALAVDLSEPAEVDRLVAECRRGRHPRRERRAAGRGTLEIFTVEEIDRALDVNLRAPIVLAHALLPAMLARRRGQLVFISSIAGKAAVPGDPRSTTPSKFGLRGFAAALRADLHGTGVGVSRVFPGFIRDAGMYVDAGVELPPGVGTRRPEDVARGVVARSSATAPRSTSRRCRLRLGRRVRDEHARPRRRRRSQARADEIARTMVKNLGDKR